MDSSTAHTSYGGAVDGLLCLMIDSRETLGSIRRTFATALQPREISVWIRGPGALAVNGQTSGVPSYGSIYISSVDGLVQNYASTQTPRHSVRVDLHQWRFIEIRNIDWVQHRYDYYLDKQLLLAAVPFNSAAATASGVTSIAVWNSAGTANQPAWIDELVLK